jgi:EAL domain-containing protein (putative c-di-GMP-specific phosphodiesterase class I)
MLSEFKKHNILIAIDDFGTGYSSLSYLIQFPIDILKIDRSFVINMLTNKASFEIVKATINLSKELNIKTVAEGVETKEQFLILKTLVCDYIQEFYFYKPMSEEEFLN